MDVLLDMCSSEQKQKNNRIYDVLSFVHTSSLGSLVYAVSSLWHGFYPGYYLFFLMFGFFQSAATSMRRKFRPLFMKKIKKGEKEMEVREGLRTEN